MPVNDRVIYANCHLSFQPDGNTNAQPSGLHGLQSVTLDTAYNTEDVNELGQLDKYDTKENVPTVTATIEKVLDGNTLIYHAATQDGTGATLNARAINMKPTILKIAVFNQGHDAASGTPLAVTICSGMFIDSLAYRFPSEGNFTESVTFVGTSKIWATGSSAGNIFTGQFASGYFGGPAGPDTPAEGVERREDLDMTNSVWPTQIHGITGAGANPDLGTKFTAHISSAEVTANLGRKDLFELGKKKAYYKLAQVPVEVLTEIEVITNEFMDNILARDDGPSNITNNQIRIRTANGVDVYMGTKNTINNVSWQGLDTGGGEFRARFSYRNVNIMTVTDPTAGGDPLAKSYP